MEKLEKDGLLYFPDDKNRRIQYKRYLRNTEYQSPKSVFYIDRRAASKELSSLLEGDVFDFPKSPQLLQRFIEAIDSSGDVILDFFSGSATTAHAVMQKNSEDAGARRHIMVQLSEPCDEKSEAFAAGYKNIAEIGKDRIRRAGEKISEELKLELEKELPGSDEYEAIKRRFDNLDTGFRVLKIDDSNMAEVYYQPDQIIQETLALQIDNVKEGREPEDLLFQVLLDWGVDLGLPINEEEIEGKKVFFVADNALAACFDTGLTEDFCKVLAKRKPLRAVFRDAGYASDSTKINIEQIFKALSPHTELKTL
jgi:adenine-specific DNA-methyltransferase